MADSIRGQVIRIIDGDTFDMKVTHVGQNNKHEYGGKERIRIASIDAPELNELGGERSRAVLERLLLGKEVRCYVQARDTYGRLVCKVTVL